MELMALLVLLAAAVMAQNLLFSRLALKRVRYSCTLSADEATEGDEMELVEVVENRGWLPVPWLKAEITTSRWLDFAGSQSVTADQARFVPSFFMVRGYQRIERRWRVTCLRRGVFGIDKVVLVSTDLFGNVSLSRPVEVSSRVTVLPRPLGPDELPPAARYLSGDETVRRHLVEDPFFRAGVHEYSERDPMNRISWLATARAGKLMAFENEYTSRRNLAVLLNVQSRPFENGEVLDAAKVEDAISVCAALFRRALREGIPLRFLCNGSTRPGREPLITGEGVGEPFIHGLMRTMASLRLESTDDFSVFLGGLSGRLEAGEIVLVTCYLSDAISRFVARQRAAGCQVQVLLLGYCSDEAVELGCEVRELHGLHETEAGV